jgi:hypothetical protein
MDLRGLRSEESRRRNYEMSSLSLRLACPVDGALDQRLEKLTRSTWQDLARLTERAKMLARRNVCPIQSQRRSVLRNGEPFQAFQRLLFLFLRKVYESSSTVVEGRRLVHGNDQERQVMVLPATSISDPGNAF